MELQSGTLRWHVLYTRQKSERKVAAEIHNLGIESYLPLHTVIRQWSDRRKKMQVPLFPNYVFVKVTSLARPTLYSIKEIVRFVSVERKPVVIAEKEIKAIKQVLCQDLDISVDDYFKEGMTVTINDGQFAGLQGVVVKKNSNTRLIIKIDGLMKAFSFNIPTHLVKAVSPELEEHPV